MTYRLRNNSINYRNDFIPPEVGQDKFARTQNAENMGYRKVKTRINQKT